MYIGGLLPFASPAGTAASHRPVPVGEPPAVQVPTPVGWKADGTPRPHTGTVAGATGSAPSLYHRRLAGGSRASAQARRAFEVKTLLSFLPEPLRVLLVPCLLALAGADAPWHKDYQRNPWLCMAWRRINRQKIQNAALDWLRGVLASEVEVGLALSLLPLPRLCRPLRNCWLALHAARIGQVADELARRPEALPLTDELWLAVMALRR